MVGGIIVLWALGRTFFQDLSEPCLNEAVQKSVSPTVRPSPIRGALACLLLFVVGTIILSPLYLAFFVEGKGYSDRAGPLPRQHAIDSNALDPFAPVSLASPYLPTLQISNRKWCRSPFLTFPALACTPA